MRRPRSASVPLALTAMVLIGLVFAVARFDERTAIRITSPAGPYPLRLKVGSTIPVEGEVDSGDATYRVAQTVILEVVVRDERYGKVIHGSWGGSYDRASRKFTGTVTVPKARAGSDFFLGVLAIDQAGGRHGSDPLAPADGGLIPIVIE